MYQSNSDTPLSQISFTFSTQTVHTKASEAKPNIRLYARDLYALITGDFTNRIASDVRTRIEFAISQNAKIKAVCEGFEDGKDYQKDLKQIITPLKTDLPHILPSGFCAVHHSDKTLEYNGVVQLDSDFKRKGGAKEAQRILLAIKSLSAAFPYILLAAISPTGYGIKIFVATSNTHPNQHREAFEQVCTALCNALQIQRGDIDTLGVSQPCFLMHDTGAYFNPNHTKFVVSDVVAPTKPTLPVFNGDITNAEKAVQYLIENKIDLGFEYSEFITFCIALVNVFGEEKGKMYANDIFSTSAKYNNESRKYIRKLKVSENREVQAGIGTIIFYAKLHGFKPEYRYVPTVQTSTIKGEKGEYLTGILERLGTALTVENICNRKWVVPTGCGKSYLIAEFAKQHKVVVVCPSNGLVNQYVGYSATAFDEKRLQATNSDQFIAVTYASSAKLGTRINTSEYHFFFDECHNCTSGDYMLKELSKCIRQIKFYQSLTLLTATDLYNFDKRLDLPTVRVTIPKPHKDLHIVPCKHVLSGTANLIKKSIELGRMPIVLMNNTKDKLTDLLKLIGDMEGLETLDSDKKHEELFAQITKDKMLPLWLRLLITTSVIKEGNDILNEMQFDIFVVGAFHHSDIEQFASRFRKSTLTTVYIMKSEEREIKDTNFEVFGRAKSIIRSAERSVNERNAEAFDFDIDTMTKEENVREAIQSQPICLKDDGSGFEIDYLRVNMRVFSNEKYYEYSNDTYQLEKLAQYGYNHITGLNTAQKDEPSEEINKGMKEAKKEAKEAAKAAYKACLVSMKNATSPMAYLHELTKTKLKKDQQKAVERVMSLHEKLGVSVTEIINTLLSEDKKELSVYSDLDFNTVAIKAQLQFLEENKAYMASLRKLPILIKAMRNEIKLGVRYDGDELRDKVVEILGYDKSIDLYPFKENGEKSGKQRIIRVLSYFFDVKFCSFTVKGESVKGYKLSKSDLFFHCKSLKNKEKIGHFLAVEADLYNEITCPF